MPTPTEQIQALLQGDAQLAKSLQSVRSADEAVTLLARAAHEKGTALTPEQIAGAIEFQAPGSAELSDAQLEGVSGGVFSNPFPVFNTAVLITATCVRMSSTATFIGGGICGAIA